MDGSDDEPFYKVKLQIGSKSWPLLIEDEYGDITQTNQLLCLFLVLIALQDYEESDDYLEWCQEYGLDASQLKWLDYFLGMEWLLRDIKSIIGQINPYISPMDHQLRSGAFAQLLKVG